MFECSKVFFPDITPMCGCQPNCQKCQPNCFTRIISFIEWSYLFWNQKPVNNFEKNGIIWNRFRKNLHPWLSLIKSTFIPNHSDAVLLLYEFFIHIVNSKIAFEMRVVYRFDWSIVNSIQHWGTSIVWLLFKYELLFFANNKNFQNTFY